MKRYKYDEERSNFANGLAFPVAIMVNLRLRLWLLSIMLDKDI